MKTHIEDQINEILKEWDPVGVCSYPKELEQEYVRYIPRIKEQLDDLSELEALLWEIGAEEIGTHHESNPEHRAFVKYIAVKLNQLVND